MKNPLAKHQCIVLRIRSRRKLLFAVHEQLLPASLRISLARQTNDDYFQHYVSPGYYSYGSWKLWNLRFE